MNILVLINPIAGGGRALKMLPKVKAWLPQRGHDFEFIIAESREQLIAEAKSASDKGYEAILAMGGDGTVHDILQTLSSDGPALGIIPCGRGEDFSRNLCLPGCLRDVCTGYAEPVIREIDIPTVNGVPFHSIAGVGFDGLVSRLTRDGSCRLQGTICYILYLLKALFIFKPVNLRIEINGRVIEDRFMMAAAANAPCYGGGMRMAPDALLDDGLLDVVLIRKMTMPRLLMQFPKVYTGRHVTVKDVSVERSNCVSISSDQELEMFADGEFMGKLPVKVEVGSRKIKVLLPGGCE